MPDESIYASPRYVTQLKECYFYHTLDVPGYGRVEGEWDLGAGVRDYLGHVDLRGKRVLDVGTANGYLTFFMESQGAEVVSYDLSPEHVSMDDVGPSRYDLERYMPEYGSFVRALNNAYWLCHRAHSSTARMVYGTVYAIPEEIGPVDVAIFGSILLHLRDPFRALQSVLRLVRDTVVIVEPLLWRTRLAAQLLARLAGPYMVFLPEHWKNSPQMTWWFLPPATVRRFVAGLGFETSRVSYHRQLFKGRKVALYTLVARRSGTYQEPGKTASTPSRLPRAHLRVGELPATVRRGQAVAVRVVAHNTGPAVWPFKSAPGEPGGFVTLGLKLCLPDGQVMADDLSRSLLPHDVPPGGQIEVQVSFSLPDTLTAGDYLLRFDMVEEGRAWFEQLGSPVAEHHFLLVEKS